ncbi:MAG: response regulator [Clostridia bacterium]|nr:response regulator [Clostridia bacterium]
MENKLEILLVEDDEQDCIEITNAVNNNPDDFILIAVTNNSERAFEHVQDSQPDAVILDLELHHGVGDGIDFLRKLKAANLPRTPYILITTNNISPYTHEIARNYGADFIMTKSQENYSANHVLELLKATKSIILNRRSVKNKDGVISFEETPTVKANRIKKRIETELITLGVNPKDVGFEHLVEAITLIMKEPVTRVCGVIGKNHNKTESSVERAMQNAIDRTWKTADTKVLETHYTAIIRSDRGTPTVTEFIHYYARVIKPN